jgi:predicted ATP-dependent serine protease
MLCELGLSGIRGHFISSEQPLSGLARLANGRNLPAEPQLILQSVTSSQGVASAIDEGKCAVCVVDSINELNGGTGTPGIALTLSRLAVSRDVIIFATAHTNHAGGLMGGDRLRKHFAQTIRLRALGDDADPHRILETETTPRRRALFKMHEGRMLDCGPLPNEEA